jgi:predicted PurR-regulated permease PerM
MAAIDRRTARVTGTVFVFVLVIGTLYAIKTTLLVLTVAVLIAYMLLPLVNLVDRLTPSRISRTLSLAVLYMVLLAGAAWAGVFIGSRVVREASSFASRLPHSIGGLQQRLEGLIPGWLEPARPLILSGVRQPLEHLSEAAIPAIGKLGAQLLSFVSDLVFVVLVPILSFLVLKDGAALRQKLLDLAASSEQKARLELFLADMHFLLGYFTRGLVILSAITLATYATVFAILRVPYSILLAATAGTLEFLPMVGPILAAAIIGSVAALSGYPHVLWILAFLGAYRLFQDYIIQPRLMGAGLKLPSLVVILGALAGEQIGGVWGLFLAVPSLAALRVIFLHLRRGPIASPRLGEDEAASIPSVPEGTFAAAGVRNAA